MANEYSYDTMKAFYRSRLGQTFKNTQEATTGLEVPNGADKWAYGVAWYHTRFGTSSGENPEIPFLAKDATYDCPHCNGTGTTDEGEWCDHCDSTGGIPNKIS